MDYKICTKVPFVDAGCYSAKDKHCIKLEDFTTTRLNAKYFISTVRNIPSTFPVLEFIYNQPESTERRRQSFPPAEIQVDLSREVWCERI